MRSILKRYEVPFVILINLLSLLLIIYIYLKEDIDYRAIGGLICGISISLGIIRNDYLKTHEKKIRKVRIAIWSCGVIVFIIGLFTTLPK
jgi:hypothetical protein